MRFDVPDKNCQQCTDLRGIFHVTRSQYIAALASPFLKVSTAIAAKTQVNMERAKDDLSRHILTCSEQQIRD